jgi:hypothetical protein
MFWGLSMLPPDQQIKFLDNWNRIHKLGEETIRKQKLEKKREEYIKWRENIGEKEIEEFTKWKIELDEKKKEEIILNFMKENPPSTFKDMFVYGNLMAKYGDKMYSKKNVGVNTEPIAKEQSKGWLGY